MSGFMYDIVILFWRVVINLFFREIRPRGTFNIPKDGPVIFVGAPHHNQFLDPLLLSSEVRREGPRRVAFLAAAASIKRLFVGAFIRMLDSIPVTRAADLAKSGSGKIYIKSDDPLLVLGIKTKFLTQCQVKGQLVLPKHVSYAQGEIAEIISDTELRLSREFITTGKGGASDVKATHKVIQENENAKQQGEEGLAFKALPYVDQHEVYGHVYKRLNENGTIGIFPEGGSHDRPDLLPLKAGVSVMALGAMSQNPNLKIKIVPVGLSYFHPHKFRSRAVVEFGTPIDVPRELVGMFDQGGAVKRDACGKLLELIHDGLKAVTIRTPDFETLMVVQAGRRLYKTPGQHWTLGQVVELTKRFIEAYQAYRDEPRVIALKDKVMHYNRRLRDLGLKDHQIERATTQRKLRNLVLLIYRSGLLLAWAILALPGVITHAPIFIPAKMYSKVKAKEALAASVVKIAARDVIATWKILFSLAATPALYIIYAVLATWLAWRNGASPMLVKSMPAIIFVVMPFFAMSSLKFGEAGMDVFKSLRPLFLSLLPGSQKELEHLRTTRASLANELSELINEFGPKLWVNFHQSRYRPAASVPQSGEAPGLLYRKGDSVDSSVLSHPMLWLDERIFGWSQSAVKGPNAWNATSRSEYGSPPLSPTESDTEDMGGADVDYDDVLAIIDTRRPKSDARERADGSNGSYSARSASNTRNAARETVIDDNDRNQHPDLHRRAPRERTSSLGASINLGQLRDATSEGHDQPFENVSSTLNASATKGKAE